MFTVNCIEKTKKEKDAGNGPLKKDKIERGTLSKEKQNPNLDGCCVHKTVILHTAKHGILRISHLFYTLAGHHYHLIITTQQNINTKIISHTQL